MTTLAAAAANMSDSFEFDTQDNCDVDELIRSIDDETAEIQTLKSSAGNNQQIVGANIIFNDFEQQFNALLASGNPISQIAFDKLTEEYSKYCDHISDMIVIDDNARDMEDTYKLSEVPLIKAHITTIDELMCKINQKIESVKPWVMHNAKRGHHFADFHSSVPNNSAASAAYTINEDYPQMYDK